MIHFFILNVLFATAALTTTSIGQAAGGRPELVLQTGHSKQVKAVRFSPDGRWIATASVDSTIRIWDTETSREIRLLAGHTGAVNVLSISPDGRLIVSGGNDGTLRLWDVESGVEIRRLANESSPVTAAEFSSNGRIVGYAGQENIVKGVDIESSAEVFAFKEHSGRVTAIAFSSDDKLLATGGEDHSVRIWSLEKKKKVRDLKGHTERVTNLLFNPDSSLLASGGLDNLAYVWQTSNGKRLSSIVIGKNAVSGLFFGSAGSLTVADRTGTLRTWELKARKETASTAQKNDVSAVGEADVITFNRDGSFAAAANGDGTATILDARSGARLATLENNFVGIYGTAFSSNGNWMAAAAFDNTVKLWDLNTGIALPPLGGHTARVRAVAFHPDNRRLISSSNDGSIRIWDALAGTSLQTLREHTKPISSLAIGKRGRFLISGSQDATVIIWDLDAGAKPRIIKPNQGEIIAVAITEDESRAAWTTIKGFLTIVDLSTGTETSVKYPGGELDAVVFSSDGKLIATAGIDTKISIRDSVSGTPLKEMKGHASQVYSVAFSSDGKTLTSAGLDRTVRIWNVEDARERQTLSGHLGAVFTASFFSGDRLIASSSDDGSVIFWKAATGERAATLLTFRNGEDWIVVTPMGYFDGSTTASRQISWRFEGNTFASRPVEEFFSEFWSPGILADINAGIEKAQSTDILTKDRRQPVLSLSAPEKIRGANDAGRFAMLRVNIISAPAGAKDVRLFRNGSLVKIWRGDAAAGQKPLEAQVPLLSGPNVFTAYAFNRDDIKSKDATLVISGQSSLRRNGVLYIIAIGINEYSNRDFDLAYAASDATSFAEEMRSRQIELRNFERVEVKTILNRSATRSGIMSAFSELTSKVQPEDSVAIFYAGHGIARDKRFYLIPNDMGYTGLRDDLDDSGLQKILVNGISDRDIEEAIEKVDADQFMIIIDACNSGQALENSEVRRGPMNSKGLAQLAYEKGIYILTASQGFQAAKEDAKLGRGYLTYALLDEGLKGRADRRPKDGKILLREWFDYAAERVPQVDQEESDSNPDRKARKLERETRKSVSQGPVKGPQRPRTFYRREAGNKQFVIAKPGDN